MRIATTSILVVVLLGCLVLGVVRQFVPPQPPETWQSLRAGDTIEQAIGKVPELELHPKDGAMRQWYHAHGEVRQVGVVHKWHMDVTFDEQGLLARVDGRSGNDARAANAEFRLPKD